MIPQETLEELREDSMEAFRHYLPHPYTPTSGGNLLTRCPLGTHQDTQASFSFNPDRGMYNCFACGASGDIFKLTMEMDAVSFARAVVLVAEHSGKTVDLGGSKPLNGVENEKKRRIRENRRMICAGLRNWHRFWASHWSREVRLATEAVDFTQQTLELAGKCFEGGDHWLFEENARNHARAQQRLLEAEYLADAFAEVGHDIGQVGRLFAEHYAKAQL